ncbi:hypothetical protein BC826DRAFT_370282 [Russula brevipes]|nr:hypothetical protein BC826DRAFT_370282 [Russula brevipes]
MSQTPTMAVATSHSNYQIVFDHALDAYKKNTGKDLGSHPLLRKLEACDSPNDILTMLRGDISGSDQSCSSNERLTKWLDPAVNILYTFSATIGADIGLVYPPAAVIFTGIGVLLSAAKATSANQEALLELFERIESFFRRLETYIKVPPTSGMVEILVKVMVEVLSILAIATKEINQNGAKTFLKKLVGRADIGDALQRLDQLTEEEARMVNAEGLKTAHDIDHKVEDIGGIVTSVSSEVQGIHHTVNDVDKRVKDVDKRVKVIDESVKDIGDKVIDGVEKISRQIVKDFNRSFPHNPNWP